MMSNGKPYQDGETLSEMYHGKGMNQYEIADEFGVSQGTIRKWMEKTGVDTNQSKAIPKQKLSTVLESEGTIIGAAESLGKTEDQVRYAMDKYGLESPNPNPRYEWSAEELRSLYWRDQMSIRQIADEYDCRFKTVLKAMQRLGIERRSMAEGQMVNRQDIIFTIGANGYERITDHYDRYGFLHHRLISVAEHGFDKVCEKDVHHETEVPWDNRPENLKLVSKSEHIGIHKPQESR